MLSSMHRKPTVAPTPSKSLQNRDFSTLKEDFENSFVFDSENDVGIHNEEFVDASEEMLDVSSKGLGVKERDKILDDLRKENFNLKLRIFFLEERLDSFCLDGDGKKSKENILLKYQSEIKELELDLMDERTMTKKALDDLAIANTLNEQLQQETAQLRMDSQEFRAVAESVKAMEAELNIIVNAETAKLNDISSPECNTVRKKLSTATEELHELKGSKLGLESVLKEATLAHDRTLTKLETNARDLEGLKMKLKSRDNDDLILADLKTEISQLKQSLDDKCHLENTLQATIHDLSVQLSESKDKTHKMQQQATEHTERIKTLQQQLMEYSKQVNDLQSGHFEKQNQHEKEISDLHEHFSKLAQEKAHELEQLIQARYKAKSPGIELMKLKSQHANEIELYQQQISDFERLSEIAATEMTHLKHELEAQTRKLHEIEESWRREKGAREAAAARDADVLEKAVRECDEKWRRLLDDERRFMKEGERELSERIQEYQAEVSGLSGELGRIRGELKARISVHEEAQRRFGEEVAGLDGENRGLRENVENVAKDREELFQMVQKLQRDNDERGQNVSDHIESFRDILVWINTVMGLPEIDLSNVNDVYILKQHIRSSLEDFQKVREYFVESLKSVEDAFRFESSQYAQKFSFLLDRLKRFEEIIKKATALQRKLKTQLEQSKQDLEATQTEQSNNIQELEALRNQIFALKNDYLIAQTKVQDVQLELDKKETQARELMDCIDGYKKEAYNLRIEVEGCKKDLESEREYSEQVVSQFKKLEEMEHETRRRLDEVEEDLRDADSREAQYKEKLRLGESLNRECQGLEHEIAEIQKQRHNEKKVLDARLRELEEELHVSKRQLEISEKHIQNLKENKVTSPLIPAFDDPASLVSANDRLRSDYFNSRRIIEDKDRSLQELRNQFTDVIHRLENSRLKHINREEKYRKTIAKAIDHIEKFNGKQGGLEVALDILKERVIV
ncbi:UNVERIFIED_CONTAM: CDK5 regulatory subunit associated protein 2 [Siphonaria sp. JEL0065]|nr:CDK5 regulatory subunit associated protein 2 [Siphonaria sp. JEL0065]